MKLLTETDLSWIADMLDVVVACQGQPWRTALERLEGLAPELESSSSQRVSQKRVAAVLGAIQRVLGRSTKADLARTCRALVLGRPALEPAERLDRIAAAARSLDISVATVEQLLWIDLPRERPVELPFGRPDELEIAAFANMQLIEKTLRRAQTAQLRIRGDAGPFLRGAARCGLLTTARPEPVAPPVPVAPPEDRTTTREDIDHLHGAIEQAKPVRVEPVRVEPVTLIDIVGPLALFHRTAVYGRALSALVPLLAEVSAFELVVMSTGFKGEYAVELGSPALLPRTSAALHGPSKQAARLARELRELLPDRRITIAPPAVVADGAYLCPDLLVGETYVELVGFWTAEHLARKRGAYEAAGLRVALCADELRGCAGEELPPDVIGYTKYVDADVVARRVDARRIVPR
ncbi:MAG TPA: DUF790 family protein [Kofleriaceae bacterium]|nr:DUF790 family protein [Kofleriaceae bacterium]